MRSLCHNPLYYGSLVASTCPLNPEEFVMSKPTPDAIDPSLVVFDSIDELDAASTDEEISELMTVAVLSAIDTMYKFADTYRVDTKHPLYNQVTNLTFHKMMCQFLYEVGYVDSDTVKLLDYCAAQFIAYEGLQRPTVEPGKVPMEFGAPFSPDAVPIAARAPRKKVRYDFRNLSREGREQLTPFKEMESGFRNFIKQWLAFNRTDVARFAIQAGLQAAPGSDVLRVLCALLPTMPKFLTTRIVSRNASVKVTSFCALMGGVGLAFAAKGGKHGPAMAGAMQEEAAVQFLGPWVGSMAGFVRFDVVPALNETMRRRLGAQMADYAKRALYHLPLAMLGASIIIKAGVDFFKIYKPQNKIAWTNKLIGASDSDDEDLEAGTMVSIQSRIASVDKYKPAMDHFGETSETDDPTTALATSADATATVAAAGDDMAKLIASYNYKQRFIEPFRNGSKRKEYKTKLQEIEKAREKATRDFYIEAERNKIDDMINEASNMLSELTELELNCEQVFAKLLSKDPKLDRFSKFLRDVKDLEKLTGDMTPFNDAAKRLFRLSKVDVQSVALPPAFFELIFDRMDTLKTLSDFKSFELLSGRQKTFVTKGEVDDVYDPNAVAVPGLEDDDDGAGVLPRPAAQNSQPGPSGDGGANASSKKTKRRKSELEALVEDQLERNKNEPRSRRQRTRSMVDDVVDAFLATRLVQ